MNPKKIQVLFSNTGDLVAEVNSITTITTPTSGLTHTAQSALGTVGEYSVEDSDPTTQTVERLEGASAMEVLQSVIMGLPGYGRVELAMTRSASAPAPGESTLEPITTRTFIADSAVRRMLDELRHADSINDIRDKHDIRAEYEGALHTLKVSNEALVRRVRDLEEEKAILRRDLEKARQGRTPQQDPPSKSSYTARRRPFGKERQSERERDKPLDRDEKKDHKDQKPSNDTTWRPGES